LVAAPQPKRIHHRLSIDEQGPHLSHTVPANGAPHTQTQQGREKTAEDAQPTIDEQPHDADHYLLAIVRPQGSE
jgi:hypothetical protein